MHRNSLPLAATLLTALAVGLTVSLVAATGPSLTSAWSDYPQGAWIAFERSEQWGTNPPTVQRQRTVLTGHRANGTTLTETREQKGGTWKRVMGGLHGAFPATGEGMALVAETPVGVVVAGAPSNCTRREYVHDENDGSGQRLLLWHCDGLELTDRVLPQWSVSFGWQLPRNVARARIDRRSTDGAVMSVELAVEARDEPLLVDGRSIPCFRERLTWTQRLGSQPEGKITTQTTRWLSPDVPGLVVKQVDDNQMGRVTRFEVTGFGLEGS